MRAPSWLIAKIRMPPPDRNPPYDPRMAARLAAAQRTSRRRLTDRIEDLFQEACLGRDFDTAEALLVACSVASRPRGPHLLGERRATGPDLAEMREVMNHRRRVAETRAERRP
jgi:hypothetical protein